jgi:hypothetical protein
MNLLKFRIPDHFHPIFRKDVDRLTRICVERGYYISEADAYHAWVAYSDANFAIWLTLDQNDQTVFHHKVKYCLVVLI